MAYGINCFLTLTCYTSANMEEAAAVATDYINSEYLLQKYSVWGYTDMIQHLTTFPPRSNISLSRSSTRKPSPKARTFRLSFMNLDLTWISELLQEITRETSRYIRHSLRSGAAPPNTKDEQIPQKIDQSYAEVDKLAQEKIQLSERLGTLIQRARTRLDYDLRRVLILQGEDPGQPAFVSTSRNPIQEMNESLRLAIAESSPIVPSPPVVLSAAPAPTQKSTFIHLSSHHLVGLQPFLT